MKVVADGEMVCELSEVQKKVIQNEISSEIFDSDMKRRLNYIMMHKYEVCMKKLRDEWIPRIKNSGAKSIPLDDDEFAQLVFSQPDYKDRKARDDEVKLLEV